MNNKGNINRSGYDPIRAAAIIICAFAGVAVTYVFFRYLFGLVLPFILGAAVAFIASAISKRLSKHTRASSKTVSAAVLVALIASIAGALFFAVRRLISELGELAEGIASGESPLSELPKHAASLAEKIGSSIAGLFPSSGAIGTEDIYNGINDFLARISDDLLTRIGAAVPGILTSILKALPDTFLLLIVTVFSAFYFTLDLEGIKSRVIRLLPARVRAPLSKIKKEAAVTALGYLRAYTLIMFITFAEMFFGLSVLGVDYSFIIAAVSALIDILPVLGVGTLLIPWALFCFITQDFFRGIGLTVLYAVIVIVRQFLEPKIIGESIGMHPLLALAAFYLGYKLFGFAGIFIAPVALIVWRAFGSLHGGSGEEA